ncbi:MAG: adventurous gliding motility protein S [Bdellovibrionaceae bacterium]|nr:adventurous gliding motility protein S [Pseudobdellovibrionaceae bacterium]
MAIYVPGKRNRHNKALNKKRSVVATLSLTAMVDMFTVLVVFLLQNYAVTGEVLEIPNGVVLPQASAVKEIKPSNVIVVSRDRITLNNADIDSYLNIREQKDWMIYKLRSQVEKLIAKGKREKNTLVGKIKTKVEEKNKKKDSVEKFLKITIQADEEVDFLTVKKIMYTITEAGIVEINFAVVKRPKPDEV